MINEICEKCIHCNGYVCKPFWYNESKKTLYDIISKLDDCLYLNQEVPRLYRFNIDLTLEDDLEYDTDYFRVLENTKEVEDELKTIPRDLIGKQFWNNKKIKSIENIYVEIFNQVDGYDITLIDRDY